MLLRMLLLLPCWDLCNTPFSAFIRYNAIKQRMTLQVFCQDKAIINIFKKVKYNLPNGIEQDVTMVSNGIHLSVYFPMSNKLADLIEGYKNEIIQQMLANVSNHGYKLQYNSLCRKRQHLTLVHPKCLKECRNRMIVTNDRATENSDGKIKTLTFVVQKISSVM